MTSDIELSIVQNMLIQMLNCPWLGNKGLVSFLHIFFSLYCLIHLWIHKLCRNTESSQIQFTATLKFRIWKYSANFSQNLQQPPEQGHHQTILGSAINLVTTDYMTGIKYHMSQYHNPGIVKIAFKQFKYQSTKLPRIMQGLKRGIGLHLEKQERSSPCQDHYQSSPSN